MKWISVKKRLPTEDETFDGRVAILDTDGKLSYAILAGQKSSKFLMSNFDVEYWLLASLSTLDYEE